MYNIFLLILFFPCTGPAGSELFLSPSWLWLWQWSSFFFSNCKYRHAEDLLLPS